MSMQITIEAISSIAPPTIAPTREMPAAIVCKRSIGSAPVRSPDWTSGASPAPTARLPSRRRRLQPEHLADGVVPFLGAFGAAALGPVGEHRAFEQLLMRLGFFGLDRHD